LAHLKAQQVRRKIPWEVIVVDNASTDDTSEVARRSWPNDTPATLRVVYERRLGLSHARNRGFSEAKYEIVSFVDDDNWVSPNWIQLVSEIMSQHPDMGACGGENEGVYEITPPWWFDRCRRCYAIGPQGTKAGDVSLTRGYLWGAGLSIRKLAWQQLLREDFHPLLVDRQGERLSTCGDSELCFALRLAGWRLWYDPRLRIRHFVPAARFEWLYLRRIFRGLGAASVILDLYHNALTGDCKTRIERVKRTWHWKILAASMKLVWYKGNSWLSLYSKLEGNADTLEMEARLGRLIELMRVRREYRLRFKPNHRVLQDYRSALRSRLVHGETGHGLARPHQD
jgi:glycosyltransferase involved in cell wall biosynthesis